MILNDNGLTTIDNTENRLITLHPYINIGVPSISALFLTVALSVTARAEESSSNSPRMKQLLQVCPEADANKDGVLTRSEAETYVKAHPETLTKLKQGGATEEKAPAQSKPQGSSPAHKEVVPLQTVTADSDEPAWMPYIRVRDGFQWTAPGAPATDQFDTKRYGMSMTSQIWTPAGVQQGATWRHDMTLWVPPGVTSDVALIFVAGSFDGPQTGSSTIAKVAAQSGIICCSLYGVIQDSFGVKGQEELSAYTVQRYMETGDPTWTMWAPATKSLVRAMDALEAATAKSGIGVPLKRFIFTGFSRHGVVSWWAAAVDKRVVGIIPTGADLLNQSMQYQVKPTLFIPGRPYGDAMDQLIKKKGLGCLSLCDPWLYRQHLTMPKLVVSGTQDHVFPLGSVGFYWDGLPEPKVNLYLANIGHGENTQVGTMQAAIAFSRLVSAGRPLPKIVWKATEAGKTVILTATTDTPAKAARIWSRLAKSMPFEVPPVFWTGS